RIQTLVSEALKRQADDGAVWVHEWGDVVEAARRASLVNDEDWGNYLARAVVVTFHARTRQRAGAELQYQLHLAPGRLGNESQIHMRATDGRLSIANLEWKWERTGWL